MSQRSSDKQKATTTISTQKISSDLLVAVDGRESNALVDTGADYSVVSYALAKDLKKVLTPWNGPHIRTAGSHLIKPLGICTARILIRGVTYVIEFIVLPDCSRDIILGMDFLHANGAIIDLQNSSVSFSTKLAIDMKEPEEPNYTALRVLDADVTVPPRCSVLVRVKNEAFVDSEGIADGNVELLLKKGICIARGIIRLRDGLADVLLTNFGNELQHVAKNTAIAFLHSFTSVTSLCTLESELPLAKTTNKAAAAVAISPHLSPAEAQIIQDLIGEFAECFSTSSRVRRTQMVKHRIITDEATRPVYQHPYRVSPKERDIIKDQVQEMLQDDVIQPSNSPWASPVVLVRKKDNTMRFCVDYRKLNSVTKRDVYPLPRIDDTLDRLRHAKYFSSLI